MTKTAGHASRKSPAAAARSRPPVVVTLGPAGQVVDMVGDPSIFAGPDATVPDVLQRLFDLLTGEGKPLETLHAIEISAGRFADIHILAEDELWHFVLLDTSDAMAVLRQKQQVSNEAALANEREHRMLYSDSTSPSERKRAQQALEDVRGGGLFATCAREMHAPLTSLFGHSEALLKRCRDDATAMRSIAAIQHAAVRLDALVKNALVCLGEPLTGDTPSASIDLRQLAVFLEDSFLLQARGRGIGLDIRIPQRFPQIGVDSLALRQLLTNLMIHALDGMDHGDLAISLSATDKHLAVELEAMPMGFPAERFGALVTTHDLLRSSPGGSLTLATAQQIMRRLGAVVELVPLQVEGYALWFQFPIRGDIIEGREPREWENGGRPAGQVGMMVEDASLAQALAEDLADMGALAVPVGTVSHLEAAAGEGELQIAVLSVPFDEQDGEEILRRLPDDVRMLLLTPPSGGGAASGWHIEGLVIRIAADADREELRGALAALLAL